MIQIIVWSLFVTAVLMLVVTVAAVWAARKLMPEFINEDGDHYDDEKY